MAKKISQESWKDIYSVFFEVYTSPTLFVREGVVPAQHIMINYLQPEDVIPIVEEE
tara:strand:+ start:2481 stop:2648 length:168 start_codon:yes stop_codon:yes gene_type:complete